MSNCALRSQSSPADTWYWPAGSRIAYLPRVSVTVCASADSTADRATSNRTHACGYGCPVSARMIRPDTTEVPGAGCPPVVEGPGSGGGQDGDPQATSATASTMEGALHVTPSGTSWRGPPPTSIG